MWWNIVARTHEEVVAWRDDWQRQITDAGLVDGRFGIPVGDERPPIPAPPLPNVRLKERPVATRPARCPGRGLCSDRSTVTNCRLRPEILRFVTHR